MARILGVIESVCRTPAARIRMGSDIVGAPPDRCDECGEALTEAEYERNRRENEAAKYDANASWCDACAELKADEADETD